METNEAVANTVATETPAIDSRESNEPTLVDVHEETGVQQETPAHPLATETHESESRSFSRRLSEARAKDRQKFEADPAYRLGQMLLNERMAKDGISADEAYNRVTSERVKQLASEYAKNPESAYEAMLRGQIGGFKQNEQPVRQTNNAQATAMSLSDQLIEARENGMMPDSFTPSDIDTKFVANVQRWGVDAALEIWSASHASTEQTVSELQRRNSAPKPIRPQANAPASAKPDFSSMSKEDFKKYEGAVKDALYAGRRVSF